MDQETTPSPRGGALTAEERDPALLCTYEREGDGKRCGNYATAGLTEGDPGFGRCRFHDGGAARSAVKAEAREAIVRMAAELDLPVPVTVGDFPQVAAEYVARMNRVFMRLELALDAKRLDMAEVADEIEFSREYADIFSQQRATALMVTKLMEAAAKLGIAASTAQVADAIWSQEFGRLLPTILDALEPYPEARLAVATALGGPLPGEILPTSPVESAIQQEEPGEPESDDEGLTLSDLL